MLNANVIEIDLSTRGINGFAVDAAPWIGGRGLAVKLFTDRCDPACDPLGPDNVLVIATSALTGTSGPTAGRGHAVFKSPLTNTIGSANSGGKWAKVLKSAGCDALIIRGAADKPTYITISDQGDSPADRVQLRDAADLWGRTVHETTDLLIARHGQDASALVTGPAGERLCCFASLMNEKNRAYGRGGPGAVLGVKNLKAIVVSGARRSEVADRDRFNDAVAQLQHAMKAQPVTKRVLRDLGTAGLVHLINVMGILPHMNFRDCLHDPRLLENISGENIRKTILEKEGGCFGCPILCQRHTRVGSERGEGPEFESAVLMGPLLDIYDLEKITLANYRANEQGLDTMSLGGTLACAAELRQIGAITSADLDGLPLQFGDPAFYPSAVEIIAGRHGIGDLMAQGSRRLAERFEHPEAAMQVKGLEIPAYDPRGMPAQALGYMTSPTGACHLRGGYSISLAFFGGFKEVPRFSVRQAAMTAKNQQDLGIIQDSLGICRFTGYALDAGHWARVYGAAIGADVDRSALERCAERAASLERIFNLRAGFARRDDDLPARFMNEPISIEGRERLITPAMRDRMLDDYYAVRGWDREGVPLKETMEELEIA
ncbi:MAG TPA: aldehyde ferredoxin oxidoreductase family protein [bacterium]|nr:aldehyde ferredoxin oxidoreductase family protein [bacterium]